jgi:hypothetical protein
MADLDRLRQVAVSARQGFFSRKPKCLALRDRVICVALCQGAALHFVDGRNGIKDFDIWTFYAGLPSVRYPARAIQNRDFGDPKFGSDPYNPGYVGRRIDLIGRSLGVEVGADPAEALQHYLKEGRTASARLLAQKAVVLLEPEDLLGTIVWTGEEAPASRNLKSQLFEEAKAATFRQYDAAIRELQK